MTNSEYELHIQESLARGANPLSEGRYKNLAPEVYAILLARDPKQLKHIDEQTPEMCLVAVRCCGKALEYVKVQTPEICLAAVTAAPEALEFVDESIFTNKSDLLEIQKIAIRKNPYAIQYCSDQTPELCELSVSLLGRAVTCIKTVSHDLAIAAIRQDPCTIMVFKNPTEDLCMTAVSTDGNCLAHIRNPTEEMCRAAIRSNPAALSHLPEAFRNLYDYAVQLHVNSLRYIRTSDQTTELCKKAVSYFPEALRYCHSQSPELCRLAVEKDPSSVKWIIRFTPEVTAALVSIPNLPEHLITPYPELHSAYQDYLLTHGLLKTAKTVW